MVLERCVILLRVKCAGYFRRENNNQITLQCIPGFEVSAVCIQFRFKISCVHKFTYIVRLADCGITAVHAPPPLPHNTMRVKPKGFVRARKQAHAISMLCLYERTKSINTIPCELCAYTIVAAAYCEV